MTTSVLVVDDDRYTRELLHTHLTKAGYTVALAEDAGKPEDARAARPVIPSSNPSGLRHGTA